jgi:ring-1,2-phenylacetyl-CoA epoxidase subunit PaaC
MSLSKIKYVLQLADNALIMGQRISEWCGHGPILEQDIALTNMALDHIGQARSLYQYAAELFNSLPEVDKQGLFLSPALSAKLVHGQDIGEDDLAYLRDAWDFRNILLAEQPNGDWAYSIIRSFFYDHFTVLLFTALKESSDQSLAAIAEKSLKEALYHRKWSSEWVIRLGDGTEESHMRISQALEDRWSYTGELFKVSDADHAMHEEGVGVDLKSIAVQWQQSVTAVLDEATLTLPPADAWMHEGGKEGRHTEHLGYILAEMQHMQRAYPGMEW